ncbi:MAG: hypothetical protein CVU27_08370 [Betaproteobacteria bacterium HGW-Betaproteobacteria-20]|nr:MAG: hypothetical protein CVU27_08370 [Betaproteobacteria bacterium HGW-Betaproteobacteria-20]
MRAITNCPSCQTQFVVTEEQLNQHQGKVRCGSCLKVFDATQHMVAPENASGRHTSREDVEEQLRAIEAGEIAETGNEETYDPAQADTITADDQDRYFNKTKKSAKSGNAFAKRLLWLVGLILLLAAIAQSIYFLRTEIAAYYPNTKPYLLLACEKLNCSLALPRKIDFIVIDDSDMQEDPEHLGLVHLTSTLINQAGFSQAYPNIELTLTDINDTPKLRRIFKPIEYLPAHTEVTKGLAAGEEVKIKLAITTPGISVSGYRLLVSY